MRGAVEGGNFDGVLISHLLSVDQNEEYVPPSTTTHYGYGYYGYYGASYTTVHEPGYYRTNTTFRVETNLYSVATGDLKSGQANPTPSTQNPSLTSSTR